MRPRGKFGFQFGRVPPDLPVVIDVPPDVFELGFVCGVANQEEASVPWGQPERNGSRGTLSFGTNGCVARASVLRVRALAADQFGLDPQHFRLEPLFSPAGLPDAMDP